MTASVYVNLHLRCARCLNDTESYNKNIVTTLNT